MAEENFSKEALAQQEKVLQKREVEAAAKDEDDRSRRELRAKGVKLATAAFPMWRRICWTYLTRTVLVPKESG
jgi:hypothetical protein